MVGVQEAPKGEFQALAGLGAAQELGCMAHLQPSLALLPILPVAFNRWDKLCFFWLFILAINVRLTMSTDDSFGEQKSQLSIPYESEAFSPSEYWAMDV